MKTASSTVARGNGTRATSAHSDEAKFQSSFSEQEAAAAPPPRPTVSQFIDELRAMLTARFHLFELEAKRAAWSAAYMFAMAAGAAILGVTAWLILVGALIVGAISAGVNWLWVVAVAIALHVGAAFLLINLVRKMADNLTFENTRRAMSRAGSAKTADRNSV